MADSNRFHQLISDLSNSLQVAVLLAGQRATAARTDTAEADELFAAVSRAAEMAHQLRSNGDEPTR